MPLTNGSERLTVTDTVKNASAMTPSTTPRRLSVFATMIALEAMDAKASAAFKRAAEAKTAADEEAALEDARRYSRMMDGLVASLEGRAA